MVTITPEAKVVVQGALAAEQDPSSLALWLEVSGVDGAAYAYDVYFKALEHVAPGDVVTHDEQLAVVVPAASVEPLTGARLELSEESEGGLVLVNPNRPGPEALTQGVPAHVLAGGIDSDLARRVIWVLESSVNPSIAGHGGRADLVGLDEVDRVAYVRLSGGCQGCAMSQMTLTQGIEATLRAEIGELTGVVDVTDHGGGENPYF
jgi:Fe/S biogenesis protein NfuA